MGVRLFVHAIRLVIDNIPDALRISAVLYIVPAVLVLVFPPPPEGQVPSLPFVLASLLGLVCGIWIAVAWHRFILLDERPAGWLPAFDGSRILSYFGYSLLLVLLSIPIIVVATFLVMPVAIAGGPAAVVLVAPLMLFVILSIAYRLGLVLPASSVGKPLKLGDAWAATRGTTGSIIVLALLSAGASLLLAVPSLLLRGPLLPVGLLWEAAVGWFSLLVGISILTVLYGHFVEGRALPD